MEEGGGKIEERGWRNEGGRMEVGGGMIEEGSGKREEG